MKILIIGGTGTISTAISHSLANSNHELYLLNRGNSNQGLPKQVNLISADINNENEVADKISGMTIEQAVQKAERDFRSPYAN